MSHPDDQPNLPAVLPTSEHGPTGRYSYAAAVQARPADDPSSFGPNSPPGHSRPSTSSSMRALQPLPSRRRFEEHGMSSGDSSGLVETREALLRHIGPPSHPVVLGVRHSAVPSSPPRVLPFMSSSSPLRARPLDASSSSLPENPRPSPAEIPMVVQRLLVLNPAITDAAVHHFYDTLTRRVTPPVSTSNQNQWPLIRSLTDADLKFDQPPLVSTFGHCMYLVTRTRLRGRIVEAVKLIEGGSNNDSPRTNLLPGLAGRKIFVYHVLLRYQAMTRPSVTVTRARLAGVSTAKTDNLPFTIVHLCGHKWCMNKDHLDIAPKSFNDEQVHCHRFLQSATNLSTMENFSRACCRHKLAGRGCWTINYRGEFADNHQWTAFH